MEVTGLDGTFTITSQSVMIVMRKHKESLMALLEAFVYDPLLNWRLIEGNGKDLLCALFSYSNCFLLVQPKAPKSTFPQAAGAPPGPGMMPAGDEYDIPPGGLGDNELPPSFRASVALKKISSLRQSQLERKLGEYFSEGLNSKAVAVITRVRDKLTGRDFDTQTKPLGVLPQVDRLIKQATSHENLCQCYIGWCPFW